MTKISLFKCDECDELVPERMEGKEKSFPYDLGWCYLYTCNFKFSLEDIRNVQNLNFCCKQCMIIYVTKFILGEKK